MRSYPPTLRAHVRQAFAASGDARAVAAQFGVSRAWVYRLVQREREGAVAPARRRLLADQEATLRALLRDGSPFVTLAELQARLPTRASRSTIARELRRLGCFRLLGILFPPWP